MRRRRYLALAGLSTLSAGCIGVPATGDLPPTEPIFDPEAAGFYMEREDELYASFAKAHHFEPADEVNLETAHRFGDEQLRHWVAVFGAGGPFETSIHFGLEQATWLPFGGRERYVGSSIQLSPANAAIYEIRYDAEFQLWLDIDDREERIYLPRDHIDCAWSAHHVLLTDDEVLIEVDTRDETVC